MSNMLVVKVFMIGEGKLENLFLEKQISSNEISVNFIKTEATVQKVTLLFQVHGRPLPLKM
jgi:hypothetical protein